MVRFRFLLGPRHVFHYIRIVPSETTCPSTFSRPLQPGQRRKPVCLSSEIISARVTIQMRTLAKILCGSGVPIPITQTQYEAFHLHYWIQLSSRIPQFMESITLPDHFHVSNAIMPPIQRRSLRMEVDISACQSQQSSVMIWAVTRES